MYGMVGFRSMGGSSGGASISSAGGVAEEGGLTKGRPMNGALVDAIDSVRPCVMVCAGMMGILLLVGSEGRSSWVDTATLA